MSNRRPLLFNSTLIAATNTTLYTVPSSVSTEILTDLTLKISNYTASATTVTVYAVPSGGSASDTNSQVKDMPVPTNDYILVPIEPLGVGGDIIAIASAATRLTACPVGGYKIHNP